MNKLIIIAIILMTIPGCATLNSATDNNDQIIQDECDLKNSVPGIHDIID